MRGDIPLFGAIDRAAYRWFPEYREIAPAVLAEGMSLSQRILLGAGRHSQDEGLKLAPGVGGNIDDMDY